ncbi:MAG TPA: hypothetical protein VMG36_05445 [Thermoplasmata archaeon]|nr:hypothetical protein [Thermoplasmata archaeon]
MAENPPGAPGPDRLRDTEAVLRRLGYARVAPDRRPKEPDASFYVQESGVPRRTFPVYVPSGDRTGVSDRIDRWLAAPRAPGQPPRRAIFVVPNDVDADEAWARLAAPGEPTIEHDVSVLVVPSATGAHPAHFHLRAVPPRFLLRIATGVVVGLFRRAQSAEGSSQIDFEEMLGILRGRFGIDVQRSLHVSSDEDALFLLYQLAQRDAFAPGDPAASLHLLVLRPTGPSARLPWFAA